MNVCPGQGLETLNILWNQLLESREPTPQQELLGLCLEARELLRKENKNSLQQCDLRLSISGKLREQAVMESERPSLLTEAEATARGLPRILTPIHIWENWKYRLGALSEDTDRKTERLREVVNSTLFVTTPEPPAGLHSNQSQLAEALAEELTHRQLEKQLPNLHGTALRLASLLEEGIGCTRSRLEREARSFRAMAPSGDLNADGEAAVRGLQTCQKLSLLGMETKPVFLGCLPQGLRSLWGGLLWPGEFIPLLRYDAAPSVLAVHHTQCDRPESSGPLFVILEVSCEALGRCSETLALLQATVPGQVCTPSSLRLHEKGGFRLIVQVASDPGEDVIWHELGELLSESNLQKPRGLMAGRCAFALAKFVATLHAGGFKLGKKKTLSRGLLFGFTRSGRVLLRLAEVVGPRLQGFKGVFDEGSADRTDGKPADVHWVASTSLQICGEGEKRTKLAAFLSEDPSKRPSADALAEILNFARCPVCFEDCSLKKMAHCTNFHSLCKDCLDECCRQPGPRRAVPLGMLRCPLSQGPGFGSSCFFTIDLLAASASFMAVQAHLEAQTKVRERLAAHHAADHESRLACSRALDKEGRQLVVMAHIEDKVLPARCPQCGQHFDTYEACAALECYSCGCAFCAWCGANCGEDAHSHVLDCPESGGPRPLPFSAPMEIFEKAQRHRRTAEVEKVLSACKDRSLAKTLRNKIQRRLEELHPKDEASGYADLWEGSEAVGGVEPPR